MTRLANYAMDCPHGETKYYCVNHDTRHASQKAMCYHPTDKKWQPSVYSNKEVLRSFDMRIVEKPFDPSTSALNCTGAPNE